MTRLVCTSDVHGMLHEMDVPDGDILVLAGDLLQNFHGPSSRHSDAEKQLVALDSLVKWLNVLPHKYVVLVAGNHDFVFQYESKKARRIMATYPKIVYLKDTGTEVCGLKFWGSPWQPTFCDWAFNLPRDGEELRKAWAKIPAGLDVLVTHGPPFRIMDSSPDVGCHEVGDKLLLERVQVVKPRFHVFGHIHGGYGRKKIDETEFLNVAACDESYMPVQRPQVIDMESR